MSGATYQVRALVLKRTKLGETDVICTLLAEDGSQLKAVAKGARKPSSSFTSRLELFSCCDLLLSQGKSLDIIKEARLVEGHAALRSSLELTEAASPMVELIERATLDELENKQLFPMTMKALSCLKDAPDESLLLITSAHLIKAVSFLGFKPELHACIGCGEEGLVETALSQNLSLAFSYLDGGVVCSHCQLGFETQWVSPAVVRWLDVLLYSTFNDIMLREVDKALPIDLLRFMQAWIKQHIGHTLKSLTFLFSYGMA